MCHPERLVRATGSSTAELRLRSAPQMPPHLVDKAVVRLCYVSVIIAVCTIIVWLGHSYLQPEIAQALSQPLVRLEMLGMVLLSVAFVLLYRTEWLSKEGILQLGVGFQIVAAFGIAIFETTVPSNPDAVVRGVSAVAIWITMCGLLIPSTPRTNLVASLFCAATWPLAYFVNTQIYPQEWIGWNRVAAWTFPLLLTALWTNVLSRRIFEMQLAADKAEELGSYTLDVRIGEGGMGEVWRAHHRMLSRDAAVKVIRPEILARYSIHDASLVRKRFEKEAQATASLRSPHTVALYDFGLSKDQSFYYVMELLEGVDLQTLVEKHGPLPAGRVRNILVQACESLEEAHRLGMVHRDIKPRNIYLCKLGLQFDFVKVLDFGLVKTLRSSKEESLLSADGSTTGTPAYMAPEVAMGAKEIDGRSDLYGLGCVAYFLLTGELVFDEPTRVAAAMAHVHKQPIPPSQRTELPIPRHLEDLVMQCLEKDPTKRVPSAWDLARRLENLPDVTRFCRDSAEEWWRLHLPSLAKHAAIEQSDSANSLDMPTVSVANGGQRTSR